MGEAGGIGGGGAGSEEGREGWHEAAESKVAAVLPLCTFLLHSGTQVARLAFGFESTCIPVVCLCLCASVHSGVRVFACLCACVHT